MNPTILGVIGPGFLNQVPTLIMTYTTLGVPYYKYSIVYKSMGLKREDEGNKGTFGLGVEGFRV